MCQPSNCSLKRVDTRWCDSKDTGPQRGGFGGSRTSIREMNEC